MGKNIKEYIRMVPDFPKQGVMFRDVTTLFADADGFRLMLDQFQAAVGELDIDAVVGIDARGFIIGGALADRLGVGFVPIRKKGKLPADTFEEEYELEYGSAVLELHQDAVAEDTNVLLVDDLIATGGTILAAAKLLDKVGANIKACAFIVSLPDLKGEAKLVAAGHNIVSLCKYDGD